MIALVTGASSGIGEAVAMRVGEAGGIAVLVARSEDKLNEVKAEIEEAGGVAHVHPGNLSELEDCDRLVNEMASDHPMHHPFHIHGAGRFLILSRDGEPESNLAWKDTVLVRSGQTVDILLDVSNPGLWMAHCHIAEHIQSGMMFSFNVARRGPTSGSAGAPTALDHEVKP